VALFDSLLALQQLDLQIDGAVKQVTLLKTMIADDHVVKEAIQRHQRQAHQLRDHQLRQRELEGEIATVTETITKDERRLYGPHVTDTKMAAAVEREIVHARQQRSEREDLLLVEMEEVDRLTGEEVSLRETVRQSQTKRASDVTDWSQQLQQVEAQVEQLRADRTQKAATVPGPALAQYERLRKSKGGRAVSELQGNVCSACRVTLSTTTVQRARVSMQFCDNCGRVLYANR